MRLGRFNLCLMFVALLAGLIGCQTTVVDESPRRTTKVHGGNLPRDSQAPVTPDHAVASDPCAARLHDIAGTMLLYYAINKHLPAGLAELQSLADADVELNFTCPASKLPYMYVPTGLRAPDRAKVIVLHDPVAVDGKRWCVLMQPSGPGAAQSLEVISIPEPLFLAYQPIQ